VEAETGGSASSTKDRFSNCHPSNIRFLSIPIYCSALKKKKKKKLKKGFRVFRK
jgi:hypothetical protein